MSRSRRLVGLVVAGGLLCLLAEGVVRLSAPPQLGVPHMRVYPQGYYTWEPGAEFTYHNLPGVVPEAARVRINSHGLRGASVPDTKEPGEVRILVIGDSYTAAVQLPEGKIFTALLQQLLARKNGGQYRVLNAGFNGAGTAHELIYFLRRGIELKPDVVVLQFTLNDIEDNIRHGGFRWDGNMLRLSPKLSEPPRWKGGLLALRDFVGNHSLAFYLCYRIIKSKVEGRPEIRVLPKRPATAVIQQGREKPQARHTSPGALARRLRPAAGKRAVAGAAPQENAGVTLAIELAKRLISSANRRGIPVVVIMIPWPLQFAVPNDHYEVMKSLFRQAMRGSPNQLVIMDPLFESALREGKPVFLEHDGHLGEAGHQLVARALVEAVNKVLAVKGSQGPRVKQFLGDPSPAMMPEE